MGIECSRRSDKGRHRNLRPGDERVVYRGGGVQRGSVGLTPSSKVINKVSARCLFRQEGKLSDGSFPHKGAARPQSVVQANRDRSDRFMHRSRTCDRQRGGVRKQKDRKRKRLNSSH